jgi:hypothetical protein
VVTQPGRVGIDSCNGSVGLAEVKAEGGVVLAQAPHDAGFNGMPCAAVSTQRVDFVLPVAEMADKLLELWENARRIELPDAKTLGTSVQAVAPFGTDNPPKLATAGHRACAGAVRPKRATHFTVGGAVAFSGTAAAAISPNAAPIASVMRVPDDLLVGGSRLEVLVAGSSSTTCASR